jgi:hypothetical protein
LGKEIIFLICKEYGRRRKRERGIERRGEGEEELEKLSLPPKYTFIHKQSSN